MENLLGRDFTRSQTSGTGTRAISCYCHRSFSFSRMLWSKFQQPGLMAVDSEVELSSRFQNSCCRPIWVSCTNECSACWGCPIFLSGLCHALSLTRTAPTHQCECHARHYNELLPFLPAVISTSFPSHPPERNQTHKVTKKCSGIVRIICLESKFSSLLHCWYRFFSLLVFQLADQMMMFPALMILCV